MDKTEKATMTTTDFEHPMIRGGGVTQCAYKLGRYKAVLVRKPDSFGPIKFLYVLIVFAPDPVCQPDPIQSLHGIT